MDTASTHVVCSDPGIAWKKDAVVAIEAPPDIDVDPDPAAVWPDTDSRTGICGAVTPNVVDLGDGRHRMYYTQIVPRDGFPEGANDYDHATTRILSSVSWDLVAWTPEPGVRLSPRDGGAGKVGRVVSPDVVALPAGGLRMYYECCRGAQLEGATIRSAQSADGLTWFREEGYRLEGGNYSAPCALWTGGETWRLYCSECGVGIVSALSEDGGLTFEREPGVRIRTGELPEEMLTAFAPEVLRIASGNYRLYYAGYSDKTRASILAAESEDGLAWRKVPDPVVVPGGRFDAAKCSEMCVVALPTSPGPAGRYRMFYEACDGTALDRRGVWRIVSATSVGNKDSADHRETL
ncbi:MAG: hypothetical protein VX733_10325 [Candidatus Latescibacterota bacterium]|nr:hypothetical protein [Candidatus Latescibacterota bacterium]